MSHSQNESVISAKNISLAYSHVSIVSHVTLDIFQGEFICILGPNGSGKSTFLRALLGLIKPVTGELSVLGNTPQQGCLHIGYMPQMRHSPALTQLSSRAILEASIQSSRYGLPMTTKAKRERIETVLEMVNAKLYANRPLEQLSGGEKQRIYLAQALLDHPKILLLDEPLSNLDPHYQDVFIQLLYHIKQTLQVTILFTAHDPNPVLKVTNRVLYFAKGKCVIGSIDDIITSRTLSALYGTPIEVMPFKNRLLVLGEDQFLHDQDYHHV